VGGFAVPLLKPSVSRNMTKRCVLAATVGAVILSALLTAGHLRLSVWSGLLAHAFLWGGIVLIVIAYQRRRTAGVALGISLSSAALCSIIAFMVGHGDYDSGLQGG
jgi:hypothetical protein